MKKIYIDTAYQRILTSEQWSIIQTSELFKSEENEQVRRYFESMEQNNKKLNNLSVQVDLLRQDTTDIKPIHTARYAIHRKR